MRTHKRHISRPQAHADDGGALVAHNSTNASLDDFTLDVTRAMRVASSNENDEENSDQLLAFDQGVGTGAPHCLEQLIQENNDVSDIQSRLRAQAQ